MRVVFLGTPEVAVPSLERVISDGHQVVAVFTQADKPAGRGNRLQPPPVKIAAQAHNLPIYQPVKIRTEEIRELFQSLAPEAALIVAYGRIIPDWLLSIPPYGFINLHFSLLPAYRGAAPINWAIVNGERETGVTTMQVVPELDAGDILLQQATLIGQQETASELGTRLSQMGAELLSETLSRLPTSTLTPQRQDGTRVSYAPVLKREDGHINWAQLRAEEVERRVRGFQPWPGAYTNLHGTRLLLWRAEVCTDLAVADNQPGTIVRADKNGIVVVCREATALNVLELQLEGRKRLLARDFLNGVRLPQEEKLDA
ncbi:MAG: methionyl-tRNA formyltransferase [Acidobacteriota bacterium]